MAAAEISRIARAQRIDLHEQAAERGGLEQVFLRLTARPGTGSAAERQDGDRMSRYGPVAGGTTRQPASRFAVPPGRL